MKFLSVNFINKTIQILLAFMFVINTGAAFYMPIFAVFVMGHIVGATLATVGLTVAIYAVSKSIIQILIAKKLDSMAGEIDDFFIILIGGIIGVIYSFGFLFIDTVMQLHALQLLAGIGDACMMASYYAIFSHHIDKNSEGFEWSLFSVGGLTVSTALGGLIGGFVAQNFGFNTVFIGAGLLNVVGVVLIVALYPHIEILRAKAHFKTIKHQEKKVKKSRKSAA